MICQKCGRENIGDAKFCASCGNPLNDVPGSGIPTEAKPVYDVAVDEMPAEKSTETVYLSELSETKAVVPVARAVPDMVIRKKSPLKLILAIGIPVVVAIVTVVVLILTGVIGSGNKDEEATGNKESVKTEAAATTNPDKGIVPEKVVAKDAVDLVKKFYTAKVNGDAEGCFELSADPVTRIMNIERGYYEDKEEAIEKIEEDLEEVKDYLEDEYGANIKISFKDMKENKKYVKDDVVLLGSSLQEVYGEYGFAKEKLTDVVVVKGKIIFQGDDDKDDEKTEVVVIKYDGKWYMNSFPELSDKDAIRTVLKQEKNKAK